MVTNEFDDSLDGSITKPTVNQLMLEESRQRKPTAQEVMIEKGLLTENKIA
jgi:hypothetical protein